LNGSDKPKQKRCLFWIIYFFEKNLSVRLGRSSFILDRDIEDPLPEDLRTSNAHVTAYAYQLVRLAGLAGSIYEQLYSPQALGASGDVRTRRALELSLKLHKYHAEARDANVRSTRPHAYTLNYGAYKTYADQRNLYNLATLGSSNQQRSRKGADPIHSCIRRSPASFNSNSHLSSHATRSRI
jgi:hypothetical protein